MYFFQGSVDKWRRDEFLSLFNVLCPEGINKELFAEYAVMIFQGTEVQGGDFLRLLPDLFHKVFTDIVVDTSHTQQAYEREFLNNFKIAVETVKTYNAINRGGNVTNYWPRDPSIEDGSFKPFLKNYHLIDKNSTVIAAAGSCFAEVISQSLQRESFQYLIAEKKTDFNADVIVGGMDKLPKSSAHWGLLFNTPSFAQLVERAFGEKEFKKILIRDTINDHGLFVDPYREGIFFRSKEAYLKDYEEHLTAVRKSILLSDIFIITPGLNECWEFMEDGTVFSRTPAVEELKFLSKLRVLTVEDNINYLQKFIDLSRKYNPDLKIIISLSPVPFVATGRGKEMHVLEANTLSKSVLRVAIEQVVKMNEDVYYFPSYEYVMNSFLDPWQKDKRHVRPEVVEKIMQLFKQTFVIQNDVEN